MGDFYQATESDIQSAIAIFLFGISISQLIYGPLSDSFGRKNILLIGLAIWLVSTLGIFVSTSVDQLYLLRLLQGIGACAGITISRAIMSDLYDREQAGQLYLIIFPFVGMSPAIAPMLGGQLAFYFGWKSCFLFMSLFIAITILLTLFRFSESLPSEKRIPFHPVTLFRNILAVLSHRRFLHFALIPCFAYASYFAYIVESPYLFSSMGLSVNLIGYTYITLSLAYVLGNLAAKKISRKIGTERTIQKGYLIFMLGGFMFALQMLISPSPIVTSILSISILTFGNGFLLPLGTANAIAAKPELSGTASGVMGSLQLGSAAIASHYIGQFSNHDLHTTGLIIGGVSLLGFVIYQLGQLQFNLQLQTKGNIK